MPPLDEEQWAFLQEELKKKPTKRQLVSFKRAEKIFKLIKAKE